MKRSALGPNKIVTGLFILGFFAAEIRVAIRWVKASSNPHIFPDRLKNQMTDYLINNVEETLIGVLLSALVLRIAIGLTRTHLFNIDRRKNIVRLLFLPSMMMWLKACIPLPSSDFWANGGTEYGFSYALGEILLIPAIWIVTQASWTLRNGNNFFTAWATLMTLVLSLIPHLPSFDGYDLNEMKARFLIGSIGFFIIALASAMCSYLRQKILREAHNQDVNSQP